MNNPDLFAEKLLAEIEHVDAVDGDSSFVDFIKARDEGRNGRFAGARFAD